MKVKTAQGKVLAIKEFNKNANKIFRQIVSEVNNVKLLNHPNITKFYDFYLVDNTKYYIVMEYCPGGSLSEHLATGILSDYEKLLLCKNIVDGLAHAHSKGIVHRDLKPDNIIIGSNNDAKICDFGCSFNLAGSEINVMQSMIGSPAYMDPRVK